MGKPTKMMNDDTPETNDAQFGTGRVSVDFARRLERQRDHLRRELEKYRGQINNEGMETACSALDCPPVVAGEYLVLPNSGISKPEE